MTTAEAIDRLPGEVRFVPSKSRPGHVYRMVWAPVSGWVHADDTCPAFTECYHRKEANMTSLVVRKPEGNEQALAERTVLLVEYDAAAISRGVDPVIAAKWAYDVPSNDGRVQGVGVRGVEEGVRLLASHGEIIRVDGVRLEHQDEQEAYFVATASRYVVGPDGSEVKLDSQTRGKRVPKWEKRANGNGEYFVKAWYELGIVKASRNAALALMPSNVKSALLRAGLDAAGGGRSQPQQQRRQAAPQQQRQRPANVDQDGVIDSTARDVTDERDAPVPGPAADNPEHDGPSVQPTRSTSNNPVDLLAAIAKQHGVAGKTAAINVMGRLYGTTMITSLSADDKADYAAILQVRLDGTEHEHEPAYTQTGDLICRVCGDAMQPPSMGGASQPALGT